MNQVISSIFQALGSITGIFGKEYRVVHSGTRASTVSNKYMSPTNRTQKLHALRSALSQLQAVDSQYRPRKRQLSRLRGCRVVEATTPLRQFFLGSITIDIEYSNSPYLFLLFIIFVFFSILCNKHKAIYQLYSRQRDLYKLSFSIVTNDYLFNITKTSIQDNVKS